MKFEWKSCGGFRYLSLKAWETQGFTHGFIGVSADFSKLRLEENGKSLCRTFHAQGIYLLDQIHGGSCHVRRIGPAGGTGRKSSTPFVRILGRGDAFVVVRKDGGVEMRYAFGIRTADCLPLIVRTEDGRVLALIHAGWRGLAAGIIEKTMKAVMAQTGAVGRMEVAIGPAAGAASYYVGREVIEAIGDCAVYSKAATEGERGGGGYLLDLASTAERIIADVAGNQGTVYRAAVCTISDERFHSYRRTGESCGSNLAFFIS